MNYRSCFFAQHAHLASLPRYALAISALLIMPAAAGAAIVNTPFGTSGEGGTINGQVLYFGSGGEVYELDAFAAIKGQDLNGSALGTAAQLSQHALPPGFDYVFSSALSDDGSDLALTYRFTNNTAAPLQSIWFGFFVDPQIDEPSNGFANEYGLSLGAPGSGPGDVDPDQWQIDEPGYVFGDIFNRLLQASLSQLNTVPFDAVDDVSLALAFELGDLAPAETATITINLSDDGDWIGSFALRHFDADVNSFDTLTLSGVSQVVPEPGSGLLALAAGITAVAGFGFHRGRLRRK